MYSYLRDVTLEEQVQHPETEADLSQKLCVGLLVNARK
jgi:hypothetical protein